ncbi:nickel pincer cofactor biosynthesis protein LarB [Eggerthellaceae bacterium zg-887]|uniref:nickel pincer cofactor biosynthesis protein LarB n=1 Tax=Xiamenia xianingshaonis TaxID=2682776 RepID=UPI00140E2398|nr:nickel pincer cofactor biosynthesis protein LarB [Xiamenia xianingshaonis]NHM16923.1 nickel pincer cofactor biosynthesis protein LarB [Xiamenia xianingshaonis]
MEKAALRSVLEQVASGVVDVDEAERLLVPATYEDIGFAKVDHARAARQSVGEVIYGAGKTAEQIAAIAQALVEGGQPSVLATRLDAEKGRRAVRLMDAAGLPSEYDDVSRTLVAGASPAPASDAGAPLVVVACGGTSDLPVAEEAARTAAFLGDRVTRLYDVGVAGIHRLLASEDVLSRATVVIAIAGMEGALASVIGGLVSCPVIGVPTSVGYGASFGGVSALLSMLNSCASGVSVVNIDNGFGAAYLAHLICQVPTRRYEG